MGRNAFPVVFDGHNDVLLRLGGPDGGGSGAFFERGEKGHLDLPRARDGGFGGGFFAVWIPSPKEQTSEPKPATSPRGLPPALDAAYALRRSMTDTARLFKIEDRSDGKFRVVCTAAELQRCLDDEVMAAVLHFEGADAIDTDLDALHVLYRAGLRSLGLVWGRPNAFAEGVAVHFRRSPDTGPGSGRDDAAGAAALRDRDDQRRSGHQLRRWHPADARGGSSRSHRRKRRYRRSGPGGRRGRGRCVLIS